MVNCPTCMKEGVYNVPEHIYAVAKKSAVAFLRKKLRTKIVLSFSKIVCLQARNDSGILNSSKNQEGGI